MTWDEKCWGIFNNIYWEMRFAGVKGFKLTSQLADQLRERDVPVPKGDGIYVRVDNDADNTKKLLSQEVVLNHFFNIASDIAGDNVVSQLLCGPLGINDAGPFESYDRDFGSKDSVGPNKPTSSSSLIGVELQTGLTHLAGADRQISGAYGLGGAKRRKGGQRGKRERKPRAFVCCPGEGSRATPVEDWGRWSEPSL